MLYMVFHLKLFQIIDERIHARHRHGVIKRGAHAAGNAVALEIQQAARRRQHLVLRQTTVLVPVIPFQTVFTEPLVGNRRGHVVGPDERRQLRIGLFVVVGTVWISCAFWLIATNSVFDADVGMSHISTVSQTRATSRYCCMDVVWDGRTLDFPVSKEDFSEIAAGDKVLVTEYDGFWGAPYYTWEIPQSP